MQGVLTAVQKDCSAAVLRPVGDDGIIAVFLLIPPDLGITEILRTPAIRQVRRSEDRIVFILFIVYPVTEGHALHLAALNITVLTLPFLHSGIH